MDSGSHDIGVRYNEAHRLLPLLEEIIQRGGRFSRVRTALGADGSLRIEVDHQQRRIALSWEEHAPEDGAGVRFAHGLVRPVGRSRSAGPEREACRRVARCLERAHAGRPPDLLLWRNRNLAEVHWGANLFNKLCPGLLRPGATHYFSYVLAGIDEYDGYLNLEFTGPDADVVVRLLPVQAAAAGDTAVVARWGPFALRLEQDTRSARMRAQREHRVEDFVGYVLARNAPERIALRFERDDPPAGYLAPDLHVDFLRRAELDDSSFFQMAWAASQEIALVTSCDRECLNLFSMLATPVEEWSLFTPWQVRPGARLLGRLHHIPLAQQDVVMGSDRLEQSLAALRQARPRPQIVIYIDSCLSRLVGEDFRSALAAHNRGGGPPVVPFEIDLRQEPYLAGVRGFLVELYRALHPKPGPPRPGSVGLIGFGPDIDPGLRQALGACGVRIDAQLFPRLSADDLRGLGRCSLLVVNAWSYVESMFADLLAETGVPCLRLPMPFGLQGSLRFAQDIARQAGSSGLEPRRCPAHARAGEAIASIRDRIAGERVALFTRADRVVQDFDPVNRFGLPLLGLLEELGLAIDLCVFSEGSRPVAEAGDLLRRLDLQPGAGHALHHFESWRQIPGLMATLKARLVYTEQFRDERITAAGKTPLTMRMLEMGFEGAVRTARRIEAALRLPFYADWAHCLPDPFRRCRPRPAKDEP